MNINIKKNIKFIKKKNNKRYKETDISSGEEQFQIKKTNKNKKCDHILKILQNKYFYQKNLIFLNKQISEKIKKNIRNIGNIGNIHKQKYYFSLKIKGYDAFFSTRFCHMKE